MTQDTATLTPARKRLIRRAYRNLDPIDAMDWLAGLPSFRHVSEKRLNDWICSLEENAASKPSQPRKQAASPFERITQANDPAVTGEWYSVVAIAAGLGVGVALVEAWQHFGWLSSAVMLSANDVRAFVRSHPLEAAHTLLRRDIPSDACEACWLWLVSVLAGSREGQGTA